MLVNLMYFALRIKITYIVIVNQNRKWILGKSLVFHNSNLILNIISTSIFISVKNKVISGYRLIIIVYIVHIKIVPIRKLLKNVKLV